MKPSWSIKKWLRSKVEILDIAKASLKVFSMRIIV